MKRSASQIALVALLLLPGFWAAPAQAASAEDAYQAARQDFLDLVKDEKRKRYRDQWMRITSQLDRSVERLPLGQRQCEALFNSGRSWHELSLISYLHADRREGIQRFERLVERCASSSLADDSLYLAAELWVRMDPDQSRRTLERLLAAYPKGDMAPKARELLAELPPPKRAPAAAPPARPAAVAAKAQPQPIPAATPRADAASTEAAAAASPEASSHTVGQERGASAPHPAEGRVVGGSSSGAAATTKNAASGERTAAAAPTVKNGASGGSAAAPSAKNAASGGSAAAPGTSAPAPNESHGSAPGDSLPSALEILAALDARGADANRPEDVALAEDLAKDRAMAAPAAAEDHPAPDRERMEAIREAVGGEIPLSLAAGLKVKRVVIDPGHGGKDTGAIGKDGTKEKDLTLAISKNLKTRLAALGLEVFLTRETDVFLSLEERTRFANDKRADLFISVHINAAENRKAHGIETYTLNLNSDRYAMRLAARENATSERSIGDLDLILADLATKANTDDSVRLARHTQDRMVQRLRARYKSAAIRDLGVKQALFFVLVGAKMPAILVEAGFISNADEARRLKAKDYQDEIARSISDGVRRFIDEREAIARGEVPSGAAVF